MVVRDPVVVVGAGLVGLATAWSLVRRGTGHPLVVVDKEAGPAVHQSGRNSGVIHSGIYYAPGSLKATLCRRGRAQLLALCREHDVPHELIGKVVVAVDESERQPLAAIASRAAANGVEARLVDAAGLAELEPAVRGVQALHTPEAGVVDYPAVARLLVDLLGAAGVDLRFGTSVVGLAARDDGVGVATDGADIDAAAVVTCAGLHSDRIAALTGDRPDDLRIVPFRGEYFRLRPAARDLCRALVYPVPDPRFPFLGVHLTRHISGEVLAGPNAVLALAREGYGWGDVAPADIWEVARNPGFWRLARGNLAQGLGEVWRSASTGAFTRALQRMTPDITADDLEPWPAGVRAQALHADGSLADDFIIRGGGRCVHVLNAPSPAATSGLAIGDHIADRVAAVVA